MKPTNNQLETIFFLFNDYTGKTHGEICLDIWEYVESELSKTYPLPSWESPTEYRCNHCKEVSGTELWETDDSDLGRTILGHSVICPNCGVIHKEAK